NRGYLGPRIKLAARPPGLPVSAASSRVIRLPWCGCPDAPQGAGSGQGDASHWVFALATETALSLVAGFRRQVERFAVPTNALPLARAPAGHQRFGVGGMRQGLPSLTFDHQIPASAPAAPRPGQITTGCRREWRRIPSRGRTMLR